VNAIGSGDALAWRGRRQLRRRCSGDALRDRAAL